MNHILKQILIPVLLATLMGLVIQPTEVLAQRQRSEQKDSRKGQAVKRSSQRSTSSRSSTRNSNKERATTRSTTRTTTRSSARTAERSNNRSTRQSSTQTRPSRSQTADRNRSTAPRVQRNNNQSRTRSTTSQVQRNNNRNGSTTSQIQRNNNQSRTRSTTSQVQRNNDQGRNRGTTAQMQHNDDRSRGNTRTRSNDDRNRNQGNTSRTQGNTNQNRNRGNTGGVRPGDDRKPGTATRILPNGVDRSGNGHVGDRGRRNQSQANQGYDRSDRSGNRPRADQRYNNRNDRRYNDQWYNNRRNNDRRYYRKPLRRYRESRYYTNYWYRRYQRYGHYYERRRYYRWHRPVLGFYIHIPSYNYYHYEYSRSYTTHFNYEQAVYVDAGYGQGNRQTKLDIRTHIRKKIRYVSGDRVRMEFQIEGISIYADGYLVGEVHSIPSSLGRIEATMHPDGYVEFDRMFYLLGDPQAGFELISTRYYNGPLLNAYEASHGLRVGVLDFYEGRVYSTGYSQLFDPGNFNGYVPISLMPDDDYWGFQYIAGGYQSNDDYYYGNYNYFEDDAYDDDGYAYRRSGTEGYTTDEIYDLSNGSYNQQFSADGSVSSVATTNRAFNNKGTAAYTTKQGHEIRIDREVQISQLAGIE